MANIERVRLRRDGGHLHVELWDGSGAEKTDSLRVKFHYSLGGSSEVERLRLAGADSYYDLRRLDLTSGAPGVLLESQSQALVSAMASLLPAGGAGGASSAPPQEEPSLRGSSA